MPKKEIKNADSEPTYQKTEKAQGGEVQIAGHENVPAKEGCLHPRLYDYTEKAELG